jgi:hypothetical protein
MMSAREDGFTRSEYTFSMADCHDCGTHFFVGWDAEKPEACDYCYETTDLIRVIYRKKVVARFHGEDMYDQADAKVEALAAEGKKATTQYVERAVITRCDAHPYEG